MDTRYTFEATPNSYFRGQDFRVTENGTGRSATVNVKDGYWAFDVKDRATFHDMPAEVQKIANDLGESRTQAIYDNIVQDFWNWADEAAVMCYHFEGTHSAGRSNGWLAVDDTYYRDPAIILDPVQATVEEGERKTAEDLRDRFLAYAFEVVGAIEKDWRLRFYDDLRAAADEPELTPEPMRVLSLVYTDGTVELYRNVPAVEATFGVATVEELIAACREAVEHPNTTYRPQWDGEEVTVCYVVVREV